MTLEWTWHHTAGVNGFSGRLVIQTSLYFTMMASLGNTTLHSSICTRSRQRLQQCASSECFPTARSLEAHCLPIYMMAFRDWTHSVQMVFLFPHASAIIITISFCIAAPNVMWLIKHKAVTLIVTLMVHTTWHMETCCNMHMRQTWKTSVQSLTFLAEHSFLFCVVTPGE